VRELPRQDRFEVCVGEVQGVGASLEITDVTAVDLELADFATIDASNALDRIDGAVDVTLKDLLIRWDVEHAGCSARVVHSLREATSLCWLDIPFSPEVSS